MKLPLPLPDRTKGIVQIHSGGFDSTTLLYWLRDEYPDIPIKALTLDYGQKMRKEIECAERISNLLNIEHQTINLSAVKPLLGDATLLSGKQEAPAGHQMDDSMRANMVPNRNMIMLSLATAWAISSGYNTVSYGCHEENYALDSQMPFIEAMRIAILKADWERVMLVTPLMGMSKAELLAVGLDIDIPYQHTYSCYRGGEKSCGLCGACVRRLEAFHTCGVEDPIEYENRDQWKVIVEKFNQGTV